MQLMTATHAGIELNSKTYHRDTETYRFKYDRDTTLPSMAVVAALLEVTDEDPFELQPLCDSVDTDALDALVRVRSPATADVHVTLTLEGYTLTVYSHGTIEATPVARERSGSLDAEMRHK